ncbi:MAG: HD domain-containing protein, partial [Clostridia bacterium]|nr:HD domain-containing protein [Clostridia bacterium]
KLKVPTAILEKNGRLTDEEFDVIKEHVFYTYQIVSKVDGCEEIAEWAGYHHEKLNGKGYPFGLTEEQIPLGTRIMTVADIFSAITEVRPYRKGMPKEKVIEVMRENVERGEISEYLVEILIAHYDEIDAVRAESSREAGRRYFNAIEETEKAEEVERRRREAEKERERVQREKEAAREAARNERDAAKENARLIKEAKRKADELAKKEAKAKAKEIEETVAKANAGVKVIRKATKKIRGSES